MGSSIGGRAKRKHFTSPVESKKAFSYASQHQKQQKAEDLNPTTVAHFSKKGNFYRSGLPI
jgi:hypothetical protein